MVNRRRFLLLSASAGLAALRAPEAIRQLDTAMTAPEQDASRAIRLISQFHALRVSAMLTNCGKAPLEHICSLGQAEPALYPSAYAMLRARTPDLLISSEAPSFTLPTGVHLLLLRPVDPAGCLRHDVDKRCVQLLPRFQFGNSRRARAAAGLSILSAHDGPWTHASVRRRTALPSPRIETPQALEQWLWQEFGEAVDFASSALCIDEVRALEANAHPGNTPGGARFTLRAGSRHEGEERIVEITIDARADLSRESARTEIVLARNGASLIFHAAPRSDHLSRLLVQNLIDSITSNSPSELVYSAESLLPARRAVASLADSLGASGTRSHLQPLNA